MKQPPALDSHTEHEIQESARKKSAQPTSLVIAHRFHIVGAERSSCWIRAASPSAEPRAAFGSSGLYASMWNRQREAEEAREKLAQIDGRKRRPNRRPATGRRSAPNPVKETARILWQPLRNNPIQHHLPQREWT